MARPRNGPLLTRDQIIQAALDLVDQDGLDALSMRKLAGQLGVDPMSIYHHVPGKDALLRALVEHVFENMSQPVRDGDWCHRVRSWATAYRALAAEHPNLVLRIVSDPSAIAVAATRINDTLYAALEASGMSADVVVASAGVLVDFVHGYCLSLTATTRQQDLHEAFQAEFRSELDKQPPDKTKTLRRLYTEGVGSDRDGFRFGLDVILHGLDTLSAQGTRRTGPPPRQND
ncbi:MAG: TetR/AcrR family transcriptional regulator [Trebonia sp.]